MKKRTSILLFSVLLFFLVGGAALAAPVTVLDDYWGAQPNNSSYANRDVIGESKYFDISKAVLTLSGTWLTVDIYTNFAGRADDKLFSNYTKDPYTDTKDGKGIGYGDLFLASEWNPYGTAPYGADNHETGTAWTYGFALDDRWSATGGTGYLYSLTGANIFLSDHFMTGSAIWREGQEVAVDTTDLAVIRSGLWSVNDGYISFSFDIAGTSLLHGPEIAFHWGQTCGNDVIEGGVPVPEPATMLLFGLGLLGLGGLKKRFKK